MRYHQIQMTNESQQLKFSIVTLRRLIGLMVRLHVPTLRFSRSTSSLVGTLFSTVHAVGFLF